jgi:protoporphyrinogen/coproporphyrinogen III oxidase
MTHAFVIRHSSFTLMPSALERPRIAIVGGGISGLAAAHRITELLPHAQLALFEAADRLGGVIHTVCRDGCLVEQAADSFITKTPWALDLCRRIGTAGELLSTNADNRRAFVVRKGALLPVPEGFVLMTPRKLWPLVTTRVLSWRGKLRLLAEPLVPSRHREPPAEPGATALITWPTAPGSAGGSYDESVASFATRRLGREAFERLVQPLLVGIYTADPARLSMAATLPEILQRHRQYGSLLRGGLKQTKNAELQSSDGEVSAIAESGARYGLFVAPKNGLSSLIDALARRLPDGAVRLNAEITSMRRDENGGWLVGLRDQAVLQRFDAVVIALPAPAAAKVVSAVDDELANDLAQIEYAGCAVVCLAYRREQIAALPAGFGFVVPLVEQRRILAASFASEKFAHRAPQDQVVVRVFVGGALQPHLLDAPDDELGRLAHQELAELLRIAGTPLWTMAAKWPGSMPQYHVGHLTRVARIEARITALAGLELAGNAYHGVGIPQCIRSGEAAAERIAGVSRDQR